MRTPILYDAIKDAEPLARISGYRATGNRKRLYEELSRQPDNFLVVGDAVCSFNPVYGQGMTVAALGAQVLEACLEERREGDFDGFSGRFRRWLAKVNSAPWALATAQDLRVPGVIGGSPTPVDGLIGRYTDGVVAHSTESGRMRLTLLEAMNMLKPPYTLFGPAVALKVLHRTLVGHGDRRRCYHDIPGRLSGADGGPM